MSLNTGPVAIKCTLEIVGFDSDKGKAFVEILSADNKTVKQLVLAITDGKVKAVVELPAAGEYAFQAFHDENNNKKLDKNPVGYPLEKWGASNNVRPPFRAPRLKEMLTPISDRKTVRIAIS